MCEPTHSIVQYNDPDNPPDNDHDLSPQAGGFNIGRLTAGLGRWSKKIRQWFHFSRLGRGHSEAIGARTGTSLHYYNDVFNLYEARWWNRSVVPDGGRAKHGIMLNCAEEYARLVSIGDTGQLRRFLEQSMLNSDRPYLYLSAVRDHLLNGTGKVEFDKRFKQCFKSKVSFASLHGVAGNLEKCIKFVSGFTRKRELLVPEWADDDKIWVPRGKVELA